MPEEPKIIGRFAFGITLYKYPDNRVEYRTQSRNEGIPIEIVLMQLRAFLRNQENDYFDNYNKGMSKFNGEDDK